MHERLGRGIGVKRRPREGHGISVPANGLDGPHQPCVILDSGRLGREPIGHEGGRTGASGWITCGVDASERFAHQVLVLIGLAYELTTGDELKQRQTMVDQEEPAVGCRDWSSGDEPSISQRRRDLAPCDQISERRRRDSFGDVPRSLMLDRPRVGVDAAVQWCEVGSVQARERADQLNGAGHGHTLALNTEPTASRHVRQPRMPLRCSSRGTHPVATGRRLRPQACPGWGSNPDCAVFKTASSTGWDTGAQR